MQPKHVSNPKTLSGTDNKGAFNPKTQTKKPVGLSYQDGQKELTPKVESPENDMYGMYGMYGYSPEDSKKLYEKNSGKTKNTIHDNLLEGKNRDGTIADIHGKYDAGTASSLSELWSIAAAYVTGTLPKGAKRFAEVSANLDLLGVIQFGTSMTFEMGKKKDGKVHLKTKVNFAKSLTIGAALMQDFGMKLKTTLGGAYQVASVGDDINECFKLMQIGIMAAMKAETNALITADKKEKGAVKRSDNKDANTMTFMKLLRWTWKKVRSAMYAIVEPGDHAEYRLDKLVNAMWDGDSGESYDQRLAEALEEMDDADMVTVKKSKGAKAGLTGEVVGNEVSGEAGLTGVTTTELTKANAKEGGKRKHHTEFKAQGELDLSLIGAKGVAAYHRQLGARPAHGELEVEIEAGISNFDMVAVGMGATIFKTVQNWLNQDKERPETDGFGLLVFTGAMTGISTQIDDAIKASTHDGTSGHGGHKSHNHKTAGDHGAHHDPKGGDAHHHDAEVAFIVKWSHSPWKFDGVDIKLVKPLAKAGLSTPTSSLKLDAGVKAKVGTMHSFDGRGKEADAGAHG